MGNKNSRSIINKRNKKNNKPLYQLEAFVNHKWCMVDISSYNNILQFSFSGENILYKLYNRCGNPVSSIDFQQEYYYNEIEQTWKEIKFSGLNCHIVDAKYCQIHHQIKQSCITQQFQHYYSKSQQTSCIIIKQHDGIYEYNLTYPQWNRIISFISYPWLKNCKYFIGTNTNKLFLSSAQLFCVFDLEKKKFNLIKSIPPENWQKMENATSFLAVYNPSNTSNERVGSFWHNDALILKKDNECKKVIRLKKFDGNLITISEGIYDKCKFVDSSKITPDLSDFLFDTQLNEIIANTTFYLPNEKNNFFECANIDESGLNFMKTKKRIIKDHEIRMRHMVYVRKLKRVYIFADDTWSHNYCKKYSYHVQVGDKGIMDDDVTKHRIVLPSIWTNYKMIKIVVVMDTIILIFNIRTGSIFAIDTIKGKVMENEKVIDGGIVKKRILDVVYDEMNMMIYAFVSDGGYYSMHLGDVIPREIVEEVIVYGYVRKNTQELYMRTPVCLFELIWLYFDSNS